MKFSKCCNVPIIDPDIAHNPMACGISNTCPKCNLMTDVYWEPKPIDYSGPYVYMNTVTIKNIFDMAKYPECRQFIFEQELVKLLNNKDRITYTLLCGDSVDISWEKRVLENNEKIRQINARVKEGKTSNTN